MCEKAEESINRVLSACSKLGQKEYKCRHDWFETKILWKICRKYGIEVKENLHEHKLEVAIENDKCKQTDHEIYGRRPDVIVVQKDKIIC